MATRKLDRRVQRTRELLLDAFVSLMIERGYQKLTVEQLLDRAGVGRATFYTHFRSKEDLLSCSVERLAAHLRQAWESTAAVGVGARERFGFTLAFFCHIDSHRRIYHLNVGRASGVTVEKHMRAMLAELVREDLRMSRDLRAAATNTEFAVHYVVGAMWSVVVWWLEERPTLSARQINDEFRRLVFSGLDSVLRA